MRVLSLALVCLLFASNATATGEMIPEGSEPPASSAPEVEKAPSGTVARATFTTLVTEREPVDSIQELGNDQSEVFFFSEVLGMAGETVTHRWEYNGQVMAEVSFDVGGPRWRVYSSKRLFSGWVGDWTVVVTDSSWRELARHQFAYVPTATNAARPPASLAPDESTPPVESSPFEPLPPDATPETPGNMPAPEGPAEQP